MKANYDSIADSWIKMRKSFPSEDLALFEMFVEGLPENAHVLDLGCGHGIPVAQFLSQRGCSISGVDRSEKLLSYAKNEMPGHQWILSDLETYEPTCTFDGVVIWDSMFHLPRDEHVRLLQKAYDTLKPNGMLILSTGGSAKNLPAFTDVMFSIEFFLRLLLHRRTTGTLSIHRL